MRDDISKSRIIAYRVLYKVFAEGAYSNLSLRYSKPMEGATREEKALATEIVYGTVRNLIYIDHVLARFIKRPVKGASLLTILRMSVYQLLFLKGVPAYTVCDQAVSLADTVGQSGSKGFVNAVLRNVLRSMDEIAAENPPIQITASMPDLIYEKYTETISQMYLSGRRTLTEEEIKSLADTAAYATTYPPGVTLRVNPLKISSDAFEQIMDDMGIEYKALHIAEDVYSVRGGADLKELADRAGEGAFAVQDPSSMMPVLALEPQPGETVLDLCAAPGSKTIMMAQQMDNRGRIISCDIYDFRVKLIEKAAAAADISIVETVTADVSGEPVAEEESADKILADVPCSGLGVIARKPEIKYSVTEELIRGNSELQRSILEAQWRCLKVGGTLVYSTCTCATEENIRVIEGFLADHREFKLQEIRNFSEMMGPKGIAMHLTQRRRGLLQVMPGIFNADGFFVAKLRRMK